MTGKRMTGLFVIIFSTISLKLPAQITTPESLKQQLIGTWEFVELRDKDNKIVDTIWHKTAYEVVKGPLLTYRSDGSYSKQFTPLNTDNGKWYFDIEQKALFTFCIIRNHMEPL